MKGGNGMEEKEFSTRGLREEVMEHGQKKKVVDVKFPGTDLWRRRKVLGKHVCSEVMSSSLFTVSCGNWELNPVCSSSSVSNYKFCKQNGHFNPPPPTHSAGNHMEW